MALPCRPLPYPGESMRSWLRRLARENGTPDLSLFLELLLPDHPAKAAICRNPDELTIRAPAWVLECLHRHTGVSSSQLRQLTFAPWISPLGRGTTEHFFHYIQGFEAIPRPAPSALYDPREATYSGAVPHYPWLPDTLRGRNFDVCPYCIQEEEHEQLVWALGLSATCPWHERDLFYDWGKARGRTTVDWLTCMAFRHGTIPLPNGGSASTRWWLRMLRSLIHEVSVPEWYFRGWNEPQGAFAEPYGTLWASRDGAPKFQSASPEPMAFEDMGSLDRKRHLNAASRALDMIIEGEIIPPDGSEAKRFSPHDRRKRLRNFGYHLSW